GLLILTHQDAEPPAPKVVQAAAPPPASASAPSPAPRRSAVPAEESLANSEPAPPVGAADFQSGFGGFGMRPGATPTEPDPPASDRYELTLRLEKGDTIDKMLADIDVPEADRKQIHEKLNALLKKRRLPAGEEIELLLQNVPEQPDAPRVLS